MPKFIIDALLACLLITSVSLNVYLVYRVSSRDSDKHTLFSFKDDSTSHCLSKSQRTSLISSYESGNSDASFRLYRHFASCTNDAIRAERWLEAAAMRNHTLAKLYLGFEMVARAETDAQADRGTRLITEAAMAGDALAQEILEDYL